MFIAQGVNSKPKRILVSNGNSELDCYYIMVLCPGFCKCTISVFTGQYV